MQVALPVAVIVVPSEDPKHKEVCPFCSDKDHKGYTTKHGALKDEDVLKKNLAAEGMVDNDNGSKLYPTPGGSDPTRGWSVKAGVFEDVPTALNAAPHHVIPGDAAMAKVHALEQWTTKSKGGMIKEDIGYNIDGAPNGIFLPRYPDLFGTKHVPGKSDKDGKGIQYREYYGRTWSELMPSEQEDIAYAIMSETYLQIHQTNHGAAYLANKELSYDKEAQALCRALADYMAKQLPLCDEQSAIPYDPPYGLVALINQQSERLKRRIVGRPRHWRAWITRLADKFTQDLWAGRVRDVSKFGISREM